MQTPGTPRGTYEYFDDHLRKVEAACATLFDIARSWGFGRIDVPTFEHTEIFRLTSQFSAEKCYLFNDKSGRELVLRPDVNAPLSRVVAANFTSSPMPVKFFFADKVFRYRHNKKREFRMFCLETFGIRDYTADIEAIKVVAEVAEQFGLTPCHVEYSDLIVPYAVIGEGLKASGSADLPAEVAYRVRQAGEAGAGAYLAENDFPPTHRDLLLEMIFTVPDNAASYELLEQAVRLCPELAREESAIHLFADTLTGTGLANRFEIGNLHGSGFYSGLTYRFVPSRLTQELADGGRYDHMVEKLGGPPIPGTGIGFGIERLIRFTDSLGNPITPKTRRGILYTVEGVEVHTAQPVIEALRRQGVIAEEDLAKRRLSKALRYAKTKDYHAVVTFVAVKQSGELVLRLTPTTEEQTLQLTGLPDEVAQSIIRAL